MKYFVTGATGHIGNNVVRTILEREPDAQVSILQRKLNNPATDGLKAKKVFGDITNPNSYKEAIDEETIVIHLAGLVDLSGKNKDLIYKVNYESTLSLVEMCIKTHVKRFIYVSSVDVINKDEITGSIKEPKRLYPEKLNSHYATTKALSTYYIMEMAKRNPGFNYAIIFPTAVIGPNDYKPSMAGKLIVDRIQGKKQFVLKGGFDFVDVRDVSNVVYELANNDVRGEFIISGTAVSVDDVYAMINEKLGDSSKPTKVPMALAMLASGLFKMVPKQALKSLSEKHNFDCSKAKKELNYETRPIKDTIFDTVMWFQDKILKEEQEKSQE